MESLKSLYDAGFIVEEEYRRRKALLEAQGITLASSSDIPLAASFGGPLENYSFSQDISVSHGSVSTTTSHTPLYAPGSVEYDVKPSEALIASHVAKNNQTRSLRLFISSTFKDMGREREILVKKVFPEIRRICATRLVNFVYIDFRWGITSEESAGGKVLELCLNEIDKSRSFFIGILGQRYGWSQQSSSIADRNLQATFDSAQEKHPWVDSYRERSVTELEMLHGALFHPSLAGHAHFYLRNPSFLDTLDSVTRRDYEPQSHGEHERLADLKARIEASTLPTTAYMTPEEFGDQVLKDLTSAIEREFPQSESSQLDEWDVQRQSQWNAARALAELYVARPAFDSAFSRLALDSSSPLVAVHGPVGCGKSALLCRWAAKTQPLVSSASGDSSSQPYVILRLIGSYSTKLHKIILSILVELKREFKLEHSIPSDKEEILHSLSEWLTIASIKRPIVLILDGLEKLDSQSQTLNWLPVVLPPQVHIIVSCPDSTKPMNTLALREAKGQAYMMAIGDMKEAERREMAVVFLNQFSKKLAHEQIYLLTSAKSSSNPLFLRCALEMLRTYGDYDSLTEYLMGLMRSRSLEELLIKSVQQWQLDYSPKDYPDFVQDFFSAIYASRGGLLESELASLLNVSQQSIWASLLDATSFALHNQAGLLSFANDHIRRAVAALYFNHAEEGSAEMEKLLAKHRARLVTFFEAKTLNPRKIYEYPYQIVKAGRASTLLLTFLSNIRVFEALYTDANKLDLFSYWQATNSSNVSTQYRDALNTFVRNEKVSPKQQGELLYKLGQFLHEFGQPSLATSFFEDALKFLEPTYGVSSLQVAEILHRFAMLKETLGLYKEAFDLASRSYSIFTRVVGNDNPKTASSVWLQALLQKKMGNYDQAVALFTNALNVAEKYYGASHPTVAVYLRTLADVYRNQALYDQATELYQRALVINRNTFGEIHPEVAEVLSNLGRIEKKKGNYDAARPLYEQAVAILIQLFGKEHMIVAEVFVQMGDVYRKIGEIGKSEELYKQALAIYRPQLGDDHPDVGEIHYLLSLSYKQIGNFDESIECSTKAIAIAEKAFGPDHLKVAAPLGALADVYSIVARYTEAVDLYKRAMKINETKLGKDHPEVSENLNALGMICKKRGQYSEAREYYTRSLEIVEKVFGPNHPKVAMYVHNLGVIYRKLKQHDESMKAFQRAMRINTDTFGADHPLVASNMVGIALAIVKSGGNLDEARDLLLKTIELLSEKLGPSHEKVALSLNYLAEVYRKQGLFGRGYAETTYEKALKINQQCYGEWNDHPELAENMNGLAQVYKAQLNYTKAEPMFKAAIAMSERTLGVNHPHVINRYRNLALMFEAQGSVLKAQDTFRKVDELKAMPPLTGE